jgi:hypothetical protein
MHTSPNRIVTQHTQHSAPGVTAREPSAASVVEGRMPLSGATQPFRNVEDRFVQLQTSADPVEARPPAARSVPGHASSSDHLLGH